MCVCFSCNPCPLFLGSVRVFYFVFIFQCRRQWKRCRHCVFCYDSNAYVRCAQWQWLSWTWNGFIYALEREDELDAECLWEDRKCAALQYCIMHARSRERIMVCGWFCLTGWMHIQLRPVPRDFGHLVNLHKTCVCTCMRCVCVLLQLNVPNHHDELNHMRFAHCLRWHGIWCFTMAMGFNKLYHIHIHIPCYVMYAVY